MTRVACIGEAMIELSHTESDTKLGVAGDTLNTAIYLKRNAPEVAVDYLTCLGDDPFSDRIETFIDAQGIGTQAIKRLPGMSPGLYAISTTDTGERSFTYWRSTSAARKMFQTKDGYDFSCLSEYDLIYMSGISVAILPDAVRIELLDWLKHNPVKVAYDSNYRPRLWEDTATAQDRTRAFWNRADVCLPSIDDEMDLFRETASDVENRFLAMGKTGALKRGPDGPAALGETVVQSYPPALHVVDTTAAGDSFNGGYLAAVLTGKSQKEALMQGHQCAAKVVQYRGAIIPGETA